MPLTATTASAWTPTARTGYAAPSSLAASRREWTSAVGFFWLASRDSLWRLAPTTGGFFFRGGSTAWLEGAATLNHPLLSPLPRSASVKGAGGGVVVSTPLGVD